MVLNSNSLQSIAEQFVIPVIRVRPSSGVVTSDIEVKIARALAQGGLRVIEITLMSESSFDAIETLSRDHNLLIGAGTCLSVDDVIRARAAGAQFFVTPGIDGEILKFAKDYHLDLISGAATPTEVMQIKRAGFNVAKIFPAANFGGASYLEALSAPFPEMKWMATGGISIEHSAEYRSAGALAIGLGSKLFPNALVQQQDWSAIAQLAKNALNAAGVG